MPKRMPTAIVVQETGPLGEVVAEILQTMLDEVGWRCLITDNPGDAVELAETKHALIVFCPPVMGEMDVLLFQSILDSQFGRHQVAVVPLIDRGDEVTLFHLIRNGIEHLLLKPFMTVHLRRIITNVAAARARRMAGHAATSAAPSASSPAA